MATKQEIYEQIMAEKKDADTWYEDFGEGLVVSGQDLVYGLKDLVAGLTPEEREMLKDWKDDAAESGWGTAGRMTGELAQFALPTGALKVASKAPKVARLAKALSKAPVTRDIVQSAALGSVRLPSEGESRAQRAGEEGLAALAGGTVGKFLQKAVKGVNILPEAKELMDAGVRLTPGQAASSKTIRGLESAASVTPILAQKTQKLRNIGSDDWIKYVLNEANPQGFDEISEIGWKGFRQLHKNVNRGYKRAWQEATEGLPVTSRKNMIQSLDDLAEYIPKEEMGVIKLVKDNIKKLGDEVDPKKLRALDLSIGEAIGSKAAKSNKLILNALQDARKTLRSNLPISAKSSLRQMDKTYPKYLVVRDATSNAAREGGKFTAEGAATAVKSVGGKTRTAAGASPLYKAMRQGAETVGKSEGGAPLEWFRRLATAVPSVAPVETVMRMTLGQTAPQRLASKVGTPVADVLRKYGITPGRVASAYEDDNL